MIAVTGATGNLGKLVIADLLKRGTNPKTVIAIVRDKSKANDLISKGVEVRTANYESTESLEKAFNGVEKLLMISGNEVGKRVPQHTNVIQAAKKSNVKLIAYTSILKADSSKMILAVEHLATEKMIQASGLPYVFLRNSWYLENYTEQFANVLASGVIAGSTNHARLSAATRADYASAATSVLLGEGKSNAIYELAGPSFTLDDLAAEVSKASGKKVEYKDLPASEFSKLLVSFGVPQGFADVLADSDLGIACGDLFTERTDLAELIHREPTSLAAAVKKAING